MYTPQEALKELLDGNHRYVSGKIIHTRRSHHRREEVALRQFPIAAVVGCSDSRVPLEVVFDHGFGDLFVIRCAGNVVGPLSLASIEFAVHYLNVPLILVLGHSRCSAIQAAMHGDKAPGHIPELIKAIHPAVKVVKKATPASWDRGVKSNVTYVVKDVVKKSRIVSGGIKKCKVAIVGGFYDLDTGKVSLLK